MNNALYLFRHGLATHSTTGYGDQIKSAVLLPEGMQQAEKIGEFLKNIRCDMFYSSEYPRCVQTSDIVAGVTKTTYHADSRLNEFNNISFDDFVANIDSFLQDIAQKENQNIFICTHVADLVILKKRILQEDIKETDIYTNDPATGVLQIITNNSLQTINCNTQL